MRTFFDSTAAGDIPNADDGLVIAYADGRYEQIAAVRARFPRARVVTISAVGVALADAVDVEPGCVWPPAAVVPWLRRARAAGIDPTVYCDRANWPAVIAAIAAAGDAQPHYWIAHYTNEPHLCSSRCYGSSVGDLVAVATQYGGDLPGHYDLNVAADHWPGIDPAQRPAGGGARIDPAPPIDQEADPMNVTIEPGKHVRIPLPAGFGVARIALAGDYEAQVGLQVRGGGVWRGTGPEGGAATVLRPGEVRTVQLDPSRDDLLDVNNGIEPAAVAASAVSVTLSRS